MRSQGVVIGLIGLTLCVSVYVAVSMPQGTNSPAVVTPRESEPGNPDTTLAIEELRTEILQLSERIEERLDMIELQVAASGPPGSKSLADGEDDSELADALAMEDASYAFADKVVENVQTQLEAKLERLASRQKNRNLGGEWKAPIDELAAELELSDPQKETAVEVFDEARDQVFDLLKTARPDGGNLLDDLVTKLREGDGEAFPGFFKRIFSEQVPGSDRTYLAEMMSLSEEVRSNLSPHLSETQVERLKTLEVAVLEVETGYDPVREYITEALAEN